jgi:hypothetical protein
MRSKEIIAVLAITSLLAIAQHPARLSNLAHANLVFAVNLSQQNTVSHLQHLAQLQLAVVGRTVRVIHGPGPRVARATLSVHAGMVPTVRS